MVIYLDVIFAINFIMNLAILYLVKLILKFRAKRFRLVIAALLGNLFLLDMFFINGKFSNTMPGKIFLSILMVLTAFYPLTLPEFLRALSLLYFVSFMVGGGAFALFYLIKNSDAFSQDLLVNNIYVPWWILLVSFAFLFIFFRLAWSVIYKRLLISSLVVPVTIYIAGEQLKIRALLDTGNDLKDPLSGNPVMIVEYPAVERFLPEEIRRCLKGDILESVQELEQLILHSSWAKRIKIIPFTSIGKNKGIMMGLKVDRICVLLDERFYEADNVVLGVCNFTLSPGGNYEALLSPESLIA
ncbi:stage II sporulation protein GA (sporulation sigma-E factor processing peptidase) [Caldanaerovirga acetigignens]|uniref:Sporulation sigma-E factor-processing peptidase n=1 Tax=Caldanaerovirga acetigignens TaxID=447595 RepID=A0A1M7FTQ4_9FIRM|nr:sigma-E processing peptidase SpoIIGA [Caldanaerovirga acetigignens]SHM07039.1 stage II sporulation protein GA (sporulation sigma-E factor processing peptidase) [Caldanaerovirga acetigignens]